MRSLALTLAFAVCSAPLSAQEAAPKADAPKVDAPAAIVPAPDATVVTTPLAPVNGTLSLTSTPSGKVFIDGKDMAMTTPVSDVPVPAGTHTVKIVADDGRTASSEFTIEAGGSLSLNLNLPEPEGKPADATPVDGTKTGATVTTPAEGTAADGTPADATVTQSTPDNVGTPDDWTWMTVSGWAGLGLGTIGLLSGAVVLTTPTDPDQGPLGFGLFGAGVGMVLGGAVLLYLDNEITDDVPAAAAAR